MNSLIKRTVVLFPIALVALSGAAFAATSSGGGGHGGGGGGGGGDGAGGAEIPTCLTGAYCPPGKSNQPSGVKADPNQKLDDPIAMNPPGGIDPYQPPFQSQPKAVAKERGKKQKPVEVGSSCQPMQVYEAVPGTTYYRIVTRCETLAGH